MDFDWPSEYRLIQETARRFIHDRLRPHEEAVELSDAIDPALMAQLRDEAAKLGLFGYNMPADVGGPGLSHLAQSLIDRELGRTTMAMGEAIGRVPETVLGFSTHQRKTILPDIIAGKKLVAVAFTEPGAGSDLNAVATRAERVEHGWRLNGVKHFISHGDTAAYVIVLAVHDPTKELSGRFGAFLVPQGRFTVLNRFRKMGWRGYPLSALAFEDCFVEHDALIGDVGDGFRGMMSMLNAGRLSIAGRCVGVTEDLLRLGTEYAGQRSTFGRLLADRDSVQFTFANIATELHAAELMVTRAAWLADKGSADIHVAAAQAKLWASEVAGRAADAVLQLFGGAGYMADLPLERIYRDVRAYRIGEGTSEILRLQVARSVMRRRGNR
jgi:alkylation response protein AidB-like acyl-CoA dehydrogenase